MNATRKEKNNQNEKRKSADTSSISKDHKMRIALDDTRNA